MRNNERVISSVLGKFLETRVHNDIITIMSDVAEMIMLYFRYTGSIPVYSGNLFDSSGIAIYHNGVIKKFIPSRKASEPRRDIYPSGLDSRSEVWGYKELDDAIANGVTKFGNGYTMVIFSSMPYAWHVNEYGSTYTSQYFDKAKEMANYSIEYVLKNFKKI